MGRWLESRIPVDDSRLAGRLEKIDGDPLWLPADREAALVWQTEQELRCQSCGRWDYEFEEEEAFFERWEADLWRCKGCEAINHRVDDIAPGTDRAGLQVRWFPVASPLQEVMHAH